MDKTFDEAIAGVRKAERGVEVREDIAQGMEYVKQYAEEVTDQQQAALQAALQAAQTAARAASTATQKAAAAAESESMAQTAATSAAQSAQSASKDAKSTGNSAASAEESANRAAAIVSTDKTLSVEGAPADAKAVSDALKNIKFPVATATTLGGVKLSEDFTADADGTLHLAGGTATDPYPVGIVISMVGDTSPAALFGGTWEQIASDRALMGASSSHAAGTTVNAGLPNITGTANGGVMSAYKPSSSGAFEATVYNVDSTPMTGNSGRKMYAYDRTFDASKSNTIYGRSTTVQPAAYYVHYWQRKA